MINGIHRVEFLAPACAAGTDDAAAESANLASLPPRLRRAALRLAGGRGTLASLVAVLQGEAGGAGAIEVVPPTQRDLLGDEVRCGRVVWREGDRLEGRAVEVLRYVPAARGALVGLGKADVAARPIGRTSVV